MCPYTYDTIMRQASQPQHLRLQMVLYARTHGVKATARVFATTPKTVRKWRDRFDGRLDSLVARSRAPHHSPRRLAPEAEQTIVALKTRLRPWSARRLKRDFQLPWSEKAIRRVFRDHGLARRYRRRKHETKRRLRDVKKRWRLFQQIDIDTKHLNDIPEYWVGLKSRRLPRYQYTARDVTTGLLFLGYADELSLAHATVFAERILVHLKACGVRLARTTWQSDNGSEFIGSWQAKGGNVGERSVGNNGARLRRRHAVPPPPLEPVLLIGPGSSPGSGIRRRQLVRSGEAMNVIAALLPPDCCHEALGNVTLEGVYFRRWERVPGRCRRSSSSGRLRLRGAALCA